MIVLDASAAAHFLLGLEPYAAWVRGRLGEAGTCAAPHLIDVEVASVVRGITLSGQISPHRGLSTLRTLAEVPVVRFPVYPLLERIWSLRHNLTAYDAAYVALAEALAVPLVTTDAALARAAGHQVAIEAFLEP